VVLEVALYGVMLTSDGILVSPPWDSGRPDDKMDAVRASTKEA